MFKLFEYNWQVRREWFEWCRAVSESELLAPRTGGRGGILATLFHVVDVEYSWIRILQQEPDFSEPFEDFASLEKVEALSERLHAEVLAFFDDWQSEQENCTLELPDDDGTMVTFTHGEILRHAAAHEIHHMGQLSVWAREMGIKPVNANLIGRGIQ
ncbi:DinB family protein [bacterium]|nr:DinB family protein [bacterium]